jgi:hypothetical protein
MKLVSLGEGGLDVAAVKPFEVRVASAKLAPQLPQNLLSGEFTAPH